MIRRQFTRQELEISANGPKFESVTPEQLFSKDSNPMLAMQVRTRNPVRYFELKEEYLYRTGQMKRPDNHFDSL